MNALRALLAARRRPAPALLPRVAQPQTLLAAWRRVKANGGGAGGDGVTPERFAARLTQELAALAGELTSGAYRPGPLRRFTRPKPNGRVRVLAVPCLRDRVAQTAALTVLMPLVDARQSADSYAYRPALGVADALGAVRRAHQAGLTWTLEADIQCFFDSIPHRRLMADLAAWIAADDMLGLIAHWLHGFSGHGAGVAQGAPISPLLANLYLHPLDRMLAAAGHRPVRYADDFVVLAGDAAAARRARRLAMQVLADRGLALKAEKTRLVAPGEPFRFLGETLCAACG